MRRYDEREWIEYMSERNQRAARIRRLRQPSLLTRLALLPDAPVILATAIAAITIVVLILTENL